jgi:hypothetical protein
MFSRKKIITLKIIINNNYKFRIKETFWKNSGEIAFRFYFSGSKSGSVEERTAGSKKVSAKRQEKKKRNTKKQLSATRIRWSY